MRKKLKLAASEQIVLFIFVCFKHELPVIIKEKNTWFELHLVCDVTDCCSQSLSLYLWGCGRSKGHDQFSNLVEEYAI